MNNPPLCIAIGNVEKFIRACKIIETLETDVRLPLSIVAEPEPSPCFFQRGVFVHQNLPRNCRVSGEAEEHRGGDHVQAVLQCPIGTSRGVAGRACDRSLFGNTRNYKMPIPMVEG